jgi:ferredoxin
MCYNRVPLLNYMKPACVAACPVAALHFDYKDALIREAERRVQRRGGSTYIMGLTEAGGTDMLTILPTSPHDLGFVVAPNKIVNHDLDKIRITAAGFMGASGLVGLMYLYANSTRHLDKKEDEQEE